MELKQMEQNPGFIVAKLAKYLMIGRGAYVCEF